MEYAIIVSLSEDGLPLYEDCVERNHAEENGLVHLTTIVIIKCGDKILVHDRKQKQLLKHKECYYTASYNLVGGHATVRSKDEDHGFVKGRPVPFNFIVDSAKRELSEELFISCAANESGAVEINMFDLFKNELHFKGVCYGKPIDYTSLEFLGYTKYSSSHNNEVSAVFFLEIPETMLDEIIMADDYEVDNVSRNVLLPIKSFSLSDLREFSDNEEFKMNRFEICDAITRLFSSENEYVLNRINKIFHSKCEPLCDHDWTDNDDGTFACSGKVATLTCNKCGKTHRYYSDTGTVID